VEVAAVPTYQNDETLASVTGGALNFNAIGNPIAVEALRGAGGAHRRVGRRAGELLIAC
jgi:hypothetical protein